MKKSRGMRITTRVALGLAGSAALLAGAGWLGLRVRPGHDRLLLRRRGGRPGLQGYGHALYELTTYLRSASLPRWVRSRI